MIIVTGAVELKPERRAEAVAACLEVVRRTKPEQGCVVYDFWADLANPNRIRVYEEWVSEEAIQSHLQQPHTQSFLAAIGEMLAAPPVIIRHEVASSGSLL